MIILMVSWVMLSPIPCLKIEKISARHGGRNEEENTEKWQKNIIKNMEFYGEKILNV